MEPDGPLYVCHEDLWKRYTSAINKTGVPMIYSIIGNLDPGRPDEGADGVHPWKWAADFAHSWRTNIDVQIGWQSVPYIVDCQKKLGGITGPEHFAGPGHWNDMDMLMIGTEKNKLFSAPLNVNQARAQMSMWSILKSPLLVSADLSNASAQQPFIDILANTEVLAVSGDVLGIEASRLEGGASIGEVYVAQTSTGYAAVLFNRQWGADTEMTLVFADFTDKTSVARVRDLWLHRDLGEFTGSFSATVPGQDVVMISIEFAPGLPSRVV